jgi:hypothetical protein
MVGLAEQLPQTNADRRSVPRSELSLGITLHRVSEAAVIPAAIANLSATGFLAELPEGAQIPAQVDVELPNAGRREAQVVWQNGGMVGCNFIAPLSRADLSAARLKSTFGESAPVEGQVEAPLEVASVAVSGPQYSLGPSDPIWDMMNETPVHEKWSPRRRLALIAAAATLPWAPLAGVALLLA